MRVLILATDIFTRGGIARYTSTLAGTLGDALGRENVQVLPLLATELDRLNSSGDECGNYRVMRATAERLTRRAKIEYAARALVRARSRFDLVICSHVGLAPIAAIVGAVYGAAYLVVCHGSEAWRRLPALKRAALRRAHAVLAVSAYTAAAVRRANELAAERVSVLYNAIPESFVRRLSPSANDAARSAGRPASRTVLSVGSLRSEHAYKGVDTMIAALPRIVAAVPEAHYVVVGDGDNRAELERRAAETGVADRVIFAGEVTDAELARHYRACDVFALPSRASVLAGSGRRTRDGRPEGEGFGRVYVEAALAGKPVVGSREGGAREAVLDGRTGLLVNPRSVPEVAGAVISLLRSPQRAAGFGAAGRRWALENFTVPAMRRALEEIVNTAVRARRRGEIALSWRPTAVAAGREGPSLAAAPADAPPSAAEQIATR